jgi:hypothetical protein
LEAEDLAAAPLAYAGWNTTANTVGTALSAAAAALIGKHFGSYDADAATSFLFERYVDDYVYRNVVRPKLNAALEQRHIDINDLGEDAPRVESQARAALWPEAVAILQRDFEPLGWHADSLEIHLPWQRTFEVRVDARLTKR